MIEDFGKFREGFCEIRIAISSTTTTTSSSSSSLSTTSRVGRERVVLVYYFE